EEMFGRGVRIRSLQKCWNCGYGLQGLATDALGRGTCPECGKVVFAEEVKGERQAARGGEEEEIPETASDRVDRVLLHPLAGLLICAAVMTGLFYTLFVLARFPMDAIDGLFRWTSKLVQGNLPDGVLRDLLSDGIIHGVGATVVFLPQICLLFFLI